MVNSSQVMLIKFVNASVKAEVLAVCRFDTFRCVLMQCHLLRSGNLRNSAKGQAMFRETVSDCRSPPLAIRLEKRLNKHGLFGRVVRRKPLLPRKEHGIKT